MIKIVVWTHSGQVGGTAPGGELPTPARPRHPANANPSRQPRSAHVGHQARCTPGSRRQICRSAAGLSSSSRRRSAPRTAPPCTLLPPYAHPVRPCNHAHHAPGWRSSVQSAGGRESERRGRNGSAAAAHEVVTGWLAGKGSPLVSCSQQQRPFPAATLVPACSKGLCSERQRRHDGAGRPARPASAVQQLHTGDPLLKNTLLPRLHTSGCPHQLSAATYHICILLPCKYGHETSIGRHEKVMKRLLYNNSL